MTGIVIEIVTFGCRLNIYESEIIRKCAVEAGLDSAEDTCGPRFVIINSCTVTAEAQRQVKQSIRKYRRNYPDAKIILTGCAVEVAFDQFVNMPEVDKIINNGDKLNIEAYSAIIRNEWVSDKHVRIPEKQPISEKKLRNDIVYSFEKKVRAFVQIQGGCDHFCSYCVIPYVRGRSRSFLPDGIIEQIQAFLDAGYKEIVLTGVDIASYGLDLESKMTLSGLIKLILRRCPKLSRLRISSIDPAACKDELLMLIGSEPRILPHIHLSVQSGNDTILSRMRRRHKRSDVLEICESLRFLRSDISIGADFITGFPGEDDDMFQDTYNLIKEADLTFLHVFPYSPRPKTEAAKLVQLPNARHIAKSRAKILRDLGNQQLQTHLSKFIGTSVNVLVENKNLAKSDHFMLVVIDKPLPEGSLAQAEVFKADDKKLFANIVEIMK